MSKQKSKFFRAILYFVKLVLFIILQIIFIPFMIVGLLIGVYKEMYLSKKYNISFSAGQALQYRWMMHHFGTREDILSVKFTKKFPCESHFGLWTTLGAVILSNRLFGFKTSLSKLVKPGEETLDKIAGNRVLMFDKIMEKYISEVDQIVLPGAGFDLITNRYAQGTNLKVYELDQENTINMKLNTLKNANIEHDYIKYIPVNYETESWGDKLLEAGFDRTKKTLFLWQSVSLYLDENQVIDSLKKMKELSAKGSIIAQDFYALAFLDGSISKVATKNMNMIAKLGEPWKFALDMSNDPQVAVEQFLNKCELEVSSYFQFGKKIDAIPFYAIVESKV